VSFRELLVFNELYGVEIFRS